MNQESYNEVQTYLSFKLSEEVFAINVQGVINILELSKITKIPKAPDYMVGVINLRGTVLPVIDLRKKFGLDEKAVTVDTSIIVVNINLNGEEVLVGVMVDSVKEVLELKNSEIAPSPTIGTKYNTSFIDGMWRTNDKFIMILNINKVFASEEVLDFKEQMSQISE
ncbi:MAG TPA: chemotaxis protein CheW [Bacteroidales bacterium]|nr:chemotaxis protein CheW [Bacteroidales bacterium]